jgi:hypothetical protein
MTFDDLEFTDVNMSHPMNQALVFFDNGYGASVIQGKGSYGGEQGLYEIAVLVKEGDEWDITYDTPITDGVIGFLSENEVTDLLKRIEDL